MTAITPKRIRPSLAHPGVLLATWFGAGYLPKAPGTWGSVGALPFAWVLVEIGGLYALGAATLVVFVVGLWASKVYMDKTGAHDPGAIVIDEVVGQWIDRKSTRLNSSHRCISYAVFCLKKKKLGSDKLNSVKNCDNASATCSATHAQLLRYVLVRW